MPQPPPDGAQLRDVQQFGALPEGRLHPLVLIGDSSTAALPVEGPTSGVGGSERFDQRGEVGGEGRGCGQTGRRCDIPLQPCLHRPRHPVRPPWPSEPDRTRSRERAGRRELDHPGGFPLQGGFESVRIRRAKRKPGSRDRADPVDRIDRPLRIHVFDRLRAVLRKAVVDELSRDVRIDVDLVVVHSHSATQSRSPDRGALLTGPAHEPLAESVDDGADRPAKLQDPSDVSVRSE